MLTNRRAYLTAPCLVAVSYLLLVLVRLFGLVEKSHENPYLGIIVLQILIFLLPAVIYVKLRGDALSGRLRFRLLGTESLLLVLFASLMLIGGSLLLNILLADGLSVQEFSLYHTYTASHDGSVESLLYITLAYAVLPAFCEEFLFRAVLGAEYESCGLLCAALLSSLLFAMIHFDFRQLIVYGFAGLVLYLTMLATRSFWGAVLVHLLFNLYGLFGQRLANEVYQTTGNNELFLILLTSVFLVSLLLFFGQAARLYRRYAARNLPSEHHTTRRQRQKNGAVTLGGALLAPPCLACYLIFLIVTIVLSSQSLS